MATPSPPTLPPAVTPAISTHVTKPQPPPSPLKPITPATTTSSSSSSVKSETTPTNTEPCTLTIPSYSAWFSWDSIHDTEKRLLPEFFGEQGAMSASRNPTSYKYYRNEIIRMFRKRPGRKLTLTEARKGLVGDVGSIRRVFDFVEEWGLINYSSSSGGGGGGAKAVKEKEKKEELVVAEKEKKDAAPQAMPKKLCTICRSICGLAYFVSEKANITLCTTCYVRSNYRPGLNSTDFKRIEVKEDGRMEWSDKETLHLLEAVFHHGEDWKKVADHVGGRSEKDCIARFVKLPFGEQFMGLVEDAEDTSMLEDDNQDDAESRGGVSKRLRLTPLADASNPIMAQVAFLSAIVGSDVAAAAAQSAVSALSEFDVNGSGIESFSKDSKEQEAACPNGQSNTDLLKEIVANAQSQLEKEQQDVEKSLSDIVEVQMKEIQHKICRFEELELLMEKEWQQLRYLRDSLFADQLAIAQHQQTTAVVPTEGIEKEASKPINDEN